jgi:hypothetical protein
MLSPSNISKAGQYCINLHNYYIRTHKMTESIIVSYKDFHFLHPDGDIFVVTFGDMYDLFNLDALDISFLHCFAL